MTLKRRLSPHLLLLLGVLAGAHSGAQEGFDSSQREEIERERERVEARYVEEERLCQEQFVVTACVDEAKRKRRVALADLTRRAAALDEAQRKERALRRQQEIRDKTAPLGPVPHEPRVPRAAASAPPLTPREPQSRPNAGPPAEESDVATARGNAEASSAPRGAEAMKPMRPAQSSAPAASAGSAAAETARRAREAQSRADFEARRRAAQEHLREVMERNAQRAASRAPAAPLPEPGASSP